MQMTVTEKSEAIEALRARLGGKIQSGAELLQARAGREFVAGTPGGGATGPRVLPDDGGCLEALEQLPCGQLSEIIEGRGRGGRHSSASSGGGLILGEMLARARREERYAVLLDVGNGFTPESFPEQDLELLLWVGCESMSQAVEALDVVSRDENFQLFLIDARDCEPTEFRRVRPAQWYRVLHQLRAHEAVAVLFARSAVTTVAKRRLEVTMPLSIESLEQEREALLGRVKVEPAVMGGASASDRSQRPGVVLQAG